LKTLKIRPVTADGRGMRQQVLTELKPRADLRLRMLAREPVYMLMSLDSGRLDLLADDLGGGGARLCVPKQHLDLFEVGQALAPSLLVLRDIGLPIVYPVVIWKSAVAIGVEFRGISERQKEMIFKFLFKIERKTVRTSAGSSLVS